MKKEPFCIFLKDEFIITLFNNEITELQNYAIEGEGLLWYILGTDAWIELQEIEEKKALVGRNYNKVFFTCFINQEIFEQIKNYEEYGIIIVSSTIDFTPEYFSTQPTKDPIINNIEEWIEEINKNDTINANGFIFCYYTKEKRKEYHKDDFID